MAPTLVKANAAQTSYPGGLVALRASDWMAAARGTLTSTTDSDACSGHRVEDSQKIVGSLVTFTDRATAYAAADDTFVIPIADISGLDSSVTYGIWISYRCVGDWDTTNPETTYASNQWIFKNMTAIGLHGIDWTNGSPVSDYADIEWSGYTIARAGHYVTDLLSSEFVMDPAETLHIRCFSVDGTTATWYIDQILFVPAGSAFLAGHDQYEIEEAFVGKNIAGSAVTTAEDGADGGDTWGKFTTGWTFTEAVPNNDSAFDFQRCADSSAAEYLTRIVPGDNYTFERPGPVEAAGHVYSLNCVRWRPDSVIVNDGFSRTVTGIDQWGSTPEGYGWRIGGTFGGGVNYETSGGEGVHRCATTVPCTFQSALGANNGFPGTYGVPEAYDGALLKISDHWSFAGQFRGVGDATWLANPDGFADVRVWGCTGDGFLYGIRFLVGHGTDAAHPGAGYWEIFKMTTGGTLGVDDDVLASGSLSGYADGTIVGWRIEMLRYYVRIRLWDASGAEPSTWDWEGFKNLYHAPGALTYPYGDNVVEAKDAYNASAADPYVCRVDTDHVAGTLELRWDNVTLEYDPLGDTPTSMFASLESPEGTEIDTVEIPYGAAYFVYWGQHDVTEDNAGTPCLSFSYKAWNDPAAPEMQRAEVGHLLFHISANFTIVSMNWAYGSQHRKRLQA